MKSRREFLAAAAALAIVPRGFAAGAPLVEVWKSPQCGCCGEWVKHLQKNGFATKVNLVEDTANARREARIPAALASCHTARVGGYSIEGHVPAGDIQRLLAEKPEAVGLAAPGMPQSAPGMDIPGHPYSVLLVRKDGSTQVYARH